MKIFLTIATSFIFFSLIAANNLEFTNIQIQANESGIIDLSLDNPQDEVAGMQFLIVDYPNHGFFTAIEPTERLTGFITEFFEQADGSVMVVVLSLTGDVVQTGSGAILSLTYQSTNQYSSEVIVSLNTDGSILGDINALPLEYTFTDGTITVLGEDPPPIQSVENLTATGGYGSISLFWDDSNVVDITGYHVFREGNLIGTSNNTSYTEAGLQQGTQYCYTVTAFNDNNESDHSDEVCATTTEIYLEEPPNLTATENGLEVFLDWDVPPSGIGIGDECLTDYGIAGFIDCSGICFDAQLADIWIGDGFCDGTAADFGVNFSCLEWDCDGCDCAGLGQNSDDCIEQCGSFSNNGNQGTSSKEMAEGTSYQGFRDLIGYEIYRDNINIAYTEGTEYLDTSDGLWYLVESCYNVVSVWDEGTSGFSNTACTTPQLEGPSSLSAQGTGSFITLDWTSTPNNDQTYFNIYRDEQLLISTTAPSYEDYDTAIGQEYCYFVKAYYDGIGESPATNTSCTSWDVYAPSNIEAVAGDQFVDLTWEEPVGGEEFSLQYDDGILANAFYFNGTYEDGLAHGTKFDVGVDFDVLAASLKILSEGDEYWPWPNGTHGPVRVLIFDDAGGAPGNLLYEEETIAEDGWATIYPNLTGLSGSFYVIATHDATFADPEGFGVDGGVDYPDNMYTYYYGEWNTGDYLGYGGDYMIASQIFAYGDIQTMSYSSVTPNVLQGNRATITSSAHNGKQFFSNSIESHPEYDVPSSRDLQSFDIYRDGAIIANVGSEVYSYRDEPINNFQEYCYTLGSNYDEGESELSNPACATPYPGPPATNLIATDLSGTIGLAWDTALVDPLFENEDDILIDYQVYRDDINIGNSTTNSYTDASEIIAGIEYCYDIRANYPSGETFSSNLACAVYVLDAPMTVLTEPDNTAHGIHISWSSPGTEGTGETIESPKFVSSIPFEDFGTTIGFMNDYDEECPYTGSTSPDVVYQWAASPGTYHLDICDSDYDTKIYVYNEELVNVGCVDDSCNDPAGNPYRSDLNLTIADAGLYYVVIDGYGGQSGNYNFTITEGVFISEDDTPQPEKNEHNLELYSNDNYTLEIMTRDLLGYRVYRDDVLLAEVDTETFEYFDAAALHDVVYCYTVKAVYDDGESIPSNTSCNQWILPPATEFDVTGTNGQVELMWIASNSAEVEEYSVYKDGTFLASTTEVFYNDTEAIHNTEYCYYVVANYGDIGNSQASDVECGMWEILSPNEVFAVGEDGVVHVTWTDPPAGGSGGIGGECELFDYYGNEIVGFLDCIEQCIDPAYLGWIGDGLCDDGSWGIYFNCDEFDWDGGDCPEYANNDNEGDYIYRTEDQLEGLAPFVPTHDRDLIAFNVYRNGDYLTTVDAGIYAYDDFDVVNLTEYCYTVTSVYEVGESIIEDDPVCATPIPGEAPSNLYAYGEAGAITLEWVGGSNQVIDYNIYRDGTLFDTSTDASYLDTTAEHDIEYCYIVSANYPSGESQSTNESCTMWVLAPPLSISASGGNGFIEVEWTEPGVVTCSDEVIPSLPFNAIGSNVGMGDDWLVQGSQGADYSYFFNVTSPIVIDITLCSANTTYDTKLEIFTADQDCNETTTGNYIDDATCEFSSLQSSLLGVSLLAGQYYIVVDGYSGQEGQYEINVTQSNLQAIAPNDILTNILLEEEKSGSDIALDDWNIADGENNTTRDLNGFDLYRDNVLIASVGPDVYSYIDQPLENGTTYCYYVIAIYDEGDSQPTPTVCAAPDAGPMCPPENLVLGIEDGDTDINLLWDFPDPNCEGGGAGGGDGNYSVECGGGSWESEVSWELYYSGNLVQNGVVGSYSFDLDPGDYTLNMYDSYGDGWNGNTWDLYDGSTLVASCTLDGYNDDGSIGTCEFSLTGVASDDEVMPVFTSDYVDPNKEPEHANQDIDDNSRIEGFNIYRGNDLIGWVPSEENTYTDNDIAFGTEYCYKVKAVYEEGESNPTETECGTVTDPGDFSVVTLGSSTVQSGEQVTIDINADNQFPIAGFQFAIEDIPDMLETMSIATTERSESFTLQFNEQDDGSVIIVGFDLTGATIDVGTGSVMELTYQTATVTEETIVVLDMVEFYLGDAVGNALPAFSENGTVIITTGPVSGCTDENACNYNPSATVDDNSCDYESCLGCTDSDATNYNPEATIDDGSCDYITLSVSDATIGLGEQGIIEISLDNQIPVAGFQFNISDSPDLLSLVQISGTERTEAFNISSNEINNEVIVLGFSFTGDVIASGSGPIISITYLASSNLGESELSLSNITLSNANGQGLPVVSENGNVIVSESGGGDVTQSIIFSPYTFNMTSFNVVPEDASVESVFGSLDLLLVKNDGSDYFVPVFGVDQIGSISIGEGYKVFLNGGSSQALEISGSQSDLSTMISLEAYTFNMLGYLPQECWPTDVVFAGHEDDVLVVKDDGSNYYVPAFGVQTLAEMCPGEGYSVFVNGSDDISFTYPSGALANTTDYIDDSRKLRSQRDDVALTGESHLIILEELLGEVQEGDILRAYANGKLVGSINIISEHLTGHYKITLPAVGSVDLSEYAGPALDHGYDVADAIDIRLYSKAQGMELAVEKAFDDDYALTYGTGPKMTVVTAEVKDAPATPTAFSLAQNHPNPFNPSTTISYNVENSSYVNLHIYDVMGRLVRTLVDNKYVSAGYQTGYTAVWNGLDNQGHKASAGLYIYRLQSGTMSTTNKMILLK